MILYLLIIILILYLIINNIDKTEYFSDEINIVQDGPLNKLGPSHYKIEIPIENKIKKRAVNTENEPAVNTENEPAVNTENEPAVNTENEPAVKKSIVIKKTNKYNLIYKKPGFYVWEPVPIDNYFPLGQIITQDNKKPTKISVLVKFNKENKPMDYTLSSMIDKMYGVWIPRGKKNIRFLSYLISKNEPSSNRIQGVHKKFVEETQLEELIKERNITIDKKKIKTRFWKIHSSPYFTTDENKTHYYLPEFNINPEKDLKVKPTKKYSKIWTNHKNSKIISVWRPEPEEDYRILGDIIINNDHDPNEVIETPTIHKSQCKNVLYYNPKPLCYTTKDTEICFWKPKTHDGYTSTGDIITTNRKEPPSDLLSSVPLEYVEENNNITNSWSDNNINVWSNNYNLFASTKYIKPSGNTYKLSDKYITYERDQSDKESNILLEYIPKNIDTTIDFSDKIVTTLSNKLDIEKNRIKINNIDRTNNNISVNIKERRHNSVEENTDKVIKELVDMVYRNKVKVLDKTQILLILHNISIKEQKETIPLDNNLFNNFVNKS